MVKGSNADLIMHVWIMWASYTLYVDWMGVDKRNNLNFMDVMSYFKGKTVLA